ncbi:MAG: non-hydrolyzing UDP-N-acetylglucosamine 2-epimerase [Acidimicrobiales bacterium]
MNVLVPFGTRPEIVKLAPVVGALGRTGLAVTTVATGQHYDPSLADTFFDDLGLHPDRQWELSGGSTERFGQMARLAADTVAEIGPDIVLLLGDTSTVPVFCLAARRHRVPVVHLEAGMRSFNPTSIEEVNRKVAAACTSLHLAPTDLAASFLRAEGIPEERIRVVGNPIIDVLVDRGVVGRTLAERRGVVMTAHRATNVDDPTRLAHLVEIARALAAIAPPVVFPIHPRTEDRLAVAGLRADLDVPGIATPGPLPYGEMLDALAGARLVVTDSGGLQEEASWLGLPTVVLRRSTPRWEGIASGASVLAGVDPQRAIDAALRLLRPEHQERIAALPCPYGDGSTGRRVAAILADPATAALVALDEPDFTDGHLPIGAAEVLPR